MGADSVENQTAKKTVRRQNKKEVEEPEAGPELCEPFAHRSAVCSAGRVFAAVSPASPAHIGPVRLDLPEVCASWCYDRNRGTAHLEGVDSLESELPQTDVTTGLTS